MKAMIERVFGYFGFVRVSDMDELIHDVKELRDEVTALTGEIDEIKRREVSVVKHIISLFKHVIVGKKDIESMFQAAQANTDLIESLNVLIVISNS